jgi:GNAT superfamily N-acetyltransferase
MNLSAMNLSAMNTIRFREATEDEDTAIAGHFFQLWRDNGIPETSIESNWLTITLQFIHQARATLDYKAFVAEVGGEIIGSTGCQRFAGLYPAVLSKHQRHYGYIWGVYVEQAHRQQGIATRLTEMATAHLSALSCNRAILHASPIGKPLYIEMGFQHSNEMFLDLNLLS